MKKFVILTLSVLAFSNVALARTPQEACDKYRASADKQIERVMSYKTYTDKMRDIKIKAIKDHAEINCNLAKDMQEARDEAKAQRAEARKAKAKAKKAEAKKDKPKQEA